MSYDFAAAGSEIVGTFDAVKQQPITMACWLKYADHPIAIEYLMMLSEDQAALDGLIGFSTIATDNQFWFITINTGGTGYYESTAGVSAYDNTWVPVLVTYDTDARYFYIETWQSGGTDSNTAVGRNPPNTLDVVSIGVNNIGGQHATFKMAEAAMWDKVLVQSEIESYFAGTAASSIAASNLIGYWPLNTDRDTPGTILNEGVAAGADLTITNAIYASDHPPIISGTNEGATGRGILRGVMRGAL